MWTTIDGGGYVIRRHAVCVCDCGAEWATQNRTNTTNSTSCKTLRTLKSDPPMFPAPNFYFVALIVVGSAITLPVSQQSTVLSCGDGISTSTTSSTRNVEYSHSILAIFIKSYLSIKLHTTTSTTQQAPYWTLEYWYTGTHNTRTKHDLLRKKN